LKTSQNSEKKEELKKNVSSLVKEGSNFVTQILRGGGRSFRILICDGSTCETKKSSGYSGGRLSLRGSINVGGQTPLEKKIPRLRDVKKELSEHGHEKKRTEIWPNATSHHRKEMAGDKCTRKKHFSPLDRRGGGKRSRNRVDQREQLTRFDIGSNSERGELKHLRTQRGRGRLLSNQMPHSKKGKKN